MTRVDPRVEQLAQQIHAEQSSDREAAVRALAATRAYQAAVPLLVATADVSRVVRAAAHVGLEQLELGKLARAVSDALHGDALAAQTLIGKGYERDRRVFDALEEIANRSLYLLRQGNMLDVGYGGSHMLLCRAIRAMGCLGDRRAVPRIRMLLRLKDRGVRTASAMALGRLQAYEAVPDLVRLLDSRDTHVRYYVEEALSLLGEDRLVRALRGLRNGDHTDEDPSWGILSLIGEGDLRVLRPLRAMLRPENDIYCRMRAAIVLCAAGEPGVEVEIRKLMDAVVDGLYSDDDACAEGTREFIACLADALLLSGSPQGVPAVVDLVADEAYWGAYADILALIAKRRPSRAVEPLAELLLTPPSWAGELEGEYQMEVIGVLEQLGDVRSFQALRAIADDSGAHLALRARAAQAYETLAVTLR